MAADDTVDLAFAGAGWIAAVHGYAVDHVPGLRISQVALPRSGAGGQRSPERIGAEPCRYEDLPAGADGVVVCTPPAQHLEHARRAIDGGVPVLIEKPLCTTLAEADELVAAAEGGARIAYAENLVHAADRPARPRPRRPAARHRPHRRAGAPVAARRGATSSPRAGAAACCSTSASTRWPWRCCWPPRPCPWRCAPTWRAPPTTRSTSTPSCRSTSTPASTPA